MAINEKKYVSLSKLDLYDEKIKEKIATDDAVVLSSAKTYSDGHFNELSANKADKVHDHNGIYSAVKLVRW